MMLISLCNSSLSSRWISSTEKMGNSSNPSISSFSFPSSSTISIFVLEAAVDSLSAVVPSPSTTFIGLPPTPPPLQTADGRGGGTSADEEAPTTALASRTERTTDKNSRCSSRCCMRTASASLCHFFAAALLSARSLAIRSFSTVRSNSAVLIFCTSVFRSWYSLELACNCSSSPIIRSFAASNAFTTSNASVSISFCWVTRSANFVSAFAHSCSAFLRAVAAFSASLRQLVSSTPFVDRLLLNVSSWAVYESILDCTLASFGPPTLKMRRCSEATSVCMVRRLGETVAISASSSSKRLWFTDNSARSTSESSHSAAWVWRRVFSSFSCSSNRCSAIRVFSSSVFRSFICLRRSLSCDSALAFWARQSVSECCNSVTISSNCFTSSAVTLPGESLAVELVLPALPDDAEAADFEFAA
mmetsp:Transcript_22939/g.38253  ORF Transcript_22939/g.38253 Transcript_22939/m.38253 type:complete len:417 (-) Transcript_22939:1591-2841(-)